jgi:formylglycine-generating enzyme required for sulfatase activity
LWALVKALLPEKGAALPDDRHDPLWSSLYWATRLIMEHLPVEDDLQAVYRPRLQPLLMALIEKGALAPVDRAEMGRVLALLGDPREGVGVKNGIAQIDWIPIPAGSFLMGSDKNKDSLASDDKTPQREMTLAAYHIARYPITYAQYEPFVRGDGYSNRDYWTEAGWGWKGDQTEPRYWDDPQWHIRNHPVVGVTWYEACAFCRWLSAELGYEVRLPTEAEWERAARGTDGRIYPYAGDYDPAKGNTSDTGIGRTSAVGSFPDGASPEGLLDMSGNVWEWCQTQWRSTYAEAEDNLAEGEAARVVGGGSFSYDQGSARAAFRLNGDPDVRYYNRGFRVVGAAPINKL